MAIRLNHDKLLRHCARGICCAEDAIQFFECFAACFDTEEVPDESLQEIPSYKNLNRRDINYQKKRERPDAYLTKTYLYWMFFRAIGPQN